MPVDELEDQEEEQFETADDEEAEFLPGELCPIDATNDRVVIEDDEYGTKTEKEAALNLLADRTSSRDLTSRRLEVRDAWKARYFYRGNQYLLPGKNGTWIMPHMVLMSGQSYDDHNDETNVYLAFADTINAALSAGTPSVRFEADNPTNPADVAASENSEGARRLIERANDMIVIQEDINRFLWTDGRSCIYTRYVIDGQRFGFADESDLDDELSYLPGFNGEEEEEQLGGSKGAPRGQEVIEAFGAIETKLPMKAKDIHGSDYIRLSQEFDITRMKSKYPDKAGEIRAMKSPTAESEYERLARTSVMMGTRPSNMTNDAMSYDCTESLTWVRPSFFKEEGISDDMRKWLYLTFPKGAMIAQVGQTLCEARNESLDDHWTLIHARPGDGMHRPGNGTPLIPLQEKLNDCMDLVHESYMHLIPITWIDSEGIDAQALNEIQRAPGQYRRLKRKPDKELAANFYTEQQIQVAEGLLVYLEKLFGEFAQFLVGAFPALFGGNTGSNDTASGIASQRDQALGRVGLTWRNIRAGYARIIRQAVQCAAEFRNSPLAGTVPGAGGVKDHISINPQDLKGNVRCFPDSDEAFPESWVAQRAVWTNLIQQAEKNPVIGAIFSKVRNLMIAKDKIGVPEVLIPGADAGVKQAGEIMQMLADGPPTPNPAIEQAKQTAPPIPATFSPEEKQAAVAKMQEAIAQLPQVVSTVQVFRLDQDAPEMDYIETWASQPEGIRARKENPEGFANVMTHYDEHAAQLAKKNADKTPPAEPKPPSESINFKDLPIPGQVQLAAKAGIKLDENAMKVEDAQDKAAEAAKAAAGHAPELLQ